MRWQFAFDVGTQTAKHSLIAAAQIGMLLCVSLILLVVAAFTYGVFTMSYIVDLLEGLVLSAFLVPFFFMMLAVPIALINGSAAALWAAFDDDFERESVRRRLLIACCLMQLIALPLLLPLLNQLSAFHSIPVYLTILPAVALTAGGIMRTAAWFDDAYGRRKPKFASQAD